MEFRNVLCCCIMLIYLVQLSESCLCLPTHPQNAFCKSNFALKVEIASERQYKYVDNFEMFVKMGIPAPRFAFHKVNILQIFRGKDELKHLLESTSVQDVYTADIYTYDNDASCGVKLENGQKYLITGRLVNGKIQVNQCDWIAEWHHVTHQMKKGLRGGYDCRCLVSTCIDGICDRKNECKLEASWDVPLDDCSMKFRACHYMNSKCAWSTSLEYNVCSRKSEIP